MLEFFFNLTPEHVLDSVEKVGTRSTGRSFALNSLENRVYEVELENGDRVVGKFYRPGRWNRETIEEEHDFLKDLVAQEIPAVAPLILDNGKTIGTTADGIFYAVFPKVRGRAPQELNHEQLLQLGRFLGRIHAVGANKEAKHRLVLSPSTYGRADLEYLVQNNWLPLELQNRYKSVCENILDHISPWFEKIKSHRIHGDCHLGNLLYNQEGQAFFLDFDDMVTGPAVQDFWLIVPAQDEEAKASREVFLKGYCEMREFDRSTLRLIEPLRTLRIIHYSAWIAKHWKDPAFPRVFSEFNTHAYWDNEIRDLERQKDLILKL